MNKIAIEAQKDFLENLAKASPIKAIAELIWNGLDAGADNVSVYLKKNGLDGLESVRVSDSGLGIDYSEIQRLFGNLGDSWKKNRARFNGRSLHGKKGQGRFKAFSIGTRVEWNTVYQATNGFMNFKIIGSSDELTDLQFTDPIAVDNHGTGTNVVITGVDKKKYGVLLKDKAVEELAKIFAIYLIQYPDIKLEYDGVVVDPIKMQNGKKDILLDKIVLPDGNSAHVSVVIVEWLMPVTRTIHLCDANGVSLQEIDAGNQFRAPGFEFTVYIKSDHFKALDKEGALDLQELHPDVELILHSVKKEVKKYFREKLFNENSQIVERWKKIQIYPFEDKLHLNPVEEAERQVFDILAVNVESYLPAFEDADINSKRFMFRLLAQALQDNPESVRRIITEMLSLKKEEQETLANLLDATSLSNIISSAKTVANRLDFLLALENLLFDKETKVKLLEREQLHKILENEAWVFDEEYALSGSEERLEEVLEKHIGILGERSDGETSVVVGDGKTGRIDLMLSRAISPRNAERDYLIVELKRPSKKIDDTVISQVKKYAMAVAADERFSGVPAKWKFIAVSNEMNEYAKNDANQSGHPKGRVWISPDASITVWIYEWAEVIHNVRSRLNFINNSLSYAASRETSRSYLIRAHEKFIPVEIKGQD